MTDNMRFYEASRSVPEEAQKQFNNGSFSGTDINPMWRIKKLTEMFGPCGVGWYYEVISERSEAILETVMAIVDLNLYIKVDGEWSKPIFGTGGNTLIRTTKTGPKPSDEGYKMALTDALSVACKALGIGADIYFSKDKTKYTQYTTGEAAQGSAEAAREAGQKKLEQIEAKMAEAAQKPAAGRQMASDEQKEYIKNNAPDDMYLNAMQAFGPYLEKMTVGQANKLIDRIKKAGAA